MTTKILKNNHVLTIRTPNRNDAVVMLDYLQIVGGETDHLTFGKEGHPFTIQEEEVFLDSLANSTTMIMLIGLIDNLIVGSVSLAGTNRQRLRHSMELGVSVRKDFWNQGIASFLILESIQEAKRLGYIEQITLKVSTNNHQAIRLYEKLGFYITGTFPKQMKLKDTYIDTYFMILPLQ
ncbi:MAG: GNAT family N-acetyltransferase [Candidatus Izemoplasmatales bacterium]|nr:GNAT family N-acetyltransferase [Candidatus Izemoplasmatales bacterium]